jgi:chemotaxis protein methyltransferase CheR
MIGEIASGDLERFRSAVTRRLGLQFDDSKLGFLAEVLQRRLGKLRRSSDGYLEGLERDPAGSEVGALAGELTVAETYFFRNDEQFRALAEIVLPARMRVARTPKVLQLLSAGCASGEEAYSMAITARQAIADPSWSVAIRAVDLNPAVLAKAARARYSAWALRSTPPAVQQRWFHAEGRDMALDDAVRSAVTFEVRNLAADDPELWRPGFHDVIFCRNVLMYFAPEQMQAAVARIARTLAPGGYLFLGHAETLRGLSDGFHLRHTHETFYYERKEGDTPSLRQPPVVPATIPAAATFTDAWVDAIRLASDRVAALVEPAPGAVASPPAQRPAPTAPAWDLGGALDLLRREQFSEALAYVQALPSGSDRDPDVLLLEAVLLAHAGALAAAEEACLRLLAIDELNAGAHYVRALCRENSGDPAEAAEHDRVALYLDPEFAMPRLHLGLLARRAGDRSAARRELGQALILLKREDASRLLLFGGGFNRAALTSLCESALRDCGGQP